MRVRNLGGRPHGRPQPNRLRVPEDGGAAFSAGWNRSAPHRMLPHQRMEWYRRYDAAMLASALGARAEVTA